VVSRAEGEAAAKCVERAVSKDLRRVGMDAMMASTCAAVVFFIAFCGVAKRNGVSDKKMIGGIDR